MGTLNPNYAVPGVTFKSLASQATTQGPGASGVLCIIGTAPQGTNQPKLVTSLADFTQEWGSSTAAAAGGFNLEPAAEICFSQAGSGAQLQLYAIRAGATQASVAVPQKVGGGSAYVFTAQAEYAGKNNLTVVVGTSTYFSASGQYIQTVAVYDNTPGLQVVLENYSGSNPAAIANLINTQSALVTVTSAGGIPSGNDDAMGQAGTYTLVGALDGSSATDADYLAAINLAQNIDCDFIAALSGSAQVQAGILTHVTSMASLNKFREGFVGFSYVGLSEAAVVAQAVSANSQLTSQYMCLLANTGGTRYNPVTRVNQVYDGFYWAAGLAAIKAINNPGDPLTRKQLSGLLSLPSTENITATDLKTLAAQGIIALSANIIQNQIVVYDGVTLADYTSVYRKENIAAQTNKLERILLSYAAPLIGTADPISNVSAIQSATLAGLNFAKQQNIIRDYNPATVAVANPSLGIYNVTLQFIPRIEIGQINFNLLLNLTLGV